MFREFIVFPSVSVSVVCPKEVESPVSGKLEMHKQIWSSLLPSVLRPHFLPVTHNSAVSLYFISPYTHHKGLAL